MSGNEFSNWDAGQGIFAVHPKFALLPKDKRNTRSKRIVRQMYRRHHDRWYKPLIHKGGKP